MEQENKNLRLFSRLTAAALGGLTAGVASAGGLLGDGRTNESASARSPYSLAAYQDVNKQDAKDAKGLPANKKDLTRPLLLQEPHICRGLNATCKGEIKGVKHDCAGQATGPTIKAHGCHTLNDCAGEGGCGQHPGENSCKGKGQCGVPLTARPWAIARKNFEAAMTKAGKKFGAAPKEQKDKKTN
jgi:hypothetical protein